MQPKLFDILIYGHSSVDFHGEQSGPSIKEMLSFRPYPGKAAMLAVGLARLGLKTALHSQVGKDSMGEFLKSKLADEKVNTHQLFCHPSSYTPIRFMTAQSNEFENQTHPLETNLDLDAINHSHALFLSASLFLDDKSQALAREAAVAAKESQNKVILCLEEKLPLAVIQSVLPLADVIFVSNPTSPFATLTQWRNLSDALIVLIVKNKIGVFSERIPENWQALLSPATKESISHEITETSLMAGFTQAWVKQNTLPQCIEKALGCQTITQSRALNCSSLPSSAELTLLGTNKKPLLTPSLHSAYFQHIHYASNLSAQHQPYFIFNLSSLYQWVQFGKTYTNNEALINQTASLVIQALQNANAHHTFSIMTDDLPNEELLAFSHLVRTVDAQETLSLEFKNDPDISRTLLSWPKGHHAKVSVQYHPDHPFALRKQQEDMLRFLHRACRATEHALWVEIAPPANSLITSGTFGHIMRRFYEIGIYPDLWQMASPRDQRSWECIQRVMKENDPYCQGIIISAQNILNAQLPFLIESVAKQKSAKGLVVNRSFLQPLLEQWFTEKLGSEALVQQLTAQFAHIVTLWEKSVNQQAVPA